MTQPTASLRRAQRAGLALCLAWALASAVARAEEERGGEVGFVGGITASDQDLTGDDNSIDPTVGVRGGVLFSNRWGWFIDGLYSKIDSTLALGDARSIAGHSAFELRFRPNKPIQWFINLGGGWMVVDFEDASYDDFHRPLAVLGFGQRLRTTHKHHLRWEVRAANTLDDTRIGGADVTQGHFLVTYTWGPGTSPRSAQLEPTKPTVVVPAAAPPATAPPAAAPPATAPPAAAPPATAPPATAAPPPPRAADQDGDRVRDNRDRCPQTPAGAVVDAQGCPLDGDHDGVPDGVDRCPNTPRGEAVSLAGCAQDSDGDGVRDTSDACPATPESAVVDEWGCPRDADGDGSPDGLDRCPETAFGARVDKDGCPIDRDGDGVPDGIDRCPETRPGAAVDETGCPASSD